MNKSNWFVITGAPCAGKTTTINALKKRGFNTTHETAREYFESQIQKGLTSEEIRKHPQQLEDSILKMQINLEAQYQPDQLLFLDIAIPDTFAYYEFHNIVIPKKLHINVQNRYNSVFFLDTVTVVHDEVRRENSDEIKKIRRLIIKQYQKLQLPVIPVPLMTINDRVEFIINQVSKI